MKRLYFYLLSICFCFAKGQDTLRFTNKIVLIVKVVEVNETSIKYYKYNNLTGPLYTKSKKDIDKIIYANGMPEPFCIKKVKPSKEDTTLSKFGFYLSGGIGLSSDYNIAASALLSNLSVAYKSHLLTLTHGSSKNLILGGEEGEQIQTTSYTGLLIGEALRYKYAIISLSSGIAITNAYINDNWTTKNLSYYAYNSQGVLSVPIELKACFLARNYIGVGIHLSENIIVSAPQFSTYYLGFCIVTGFWNITKKKFR